MGVRTQVLVEKFNAANAGFIALVEGLTPEQWQAAVLPEKRTVAITAHHVANSLVPTAGATTMLANGQALPLTEAMIDQGAIDHAKEHANATKAEVLALARQNGAAAAGMISALSDAQLDNTGAVFFTGGQPFPAGSFAEAVWIGHIVDHTNNIKTALGK